jgi:hypothetical protein
MLKSLLKPGERQPFIQFGMKGKDIVEKATLM